LIIFSNLERNSERELRAAIKHAERAGLKDEDNKNKVFCTQKLLSAYKALYELEQKHKEDKMMLQHEQALEEHFVRTEALGSDRNQSLYWRFKGDPGRLFKQTIRRDNADQPIGPEPLLEEEDLASITLCKLFQSRPAKNTYSWSVYSTNTELYLLCEALDDRGERLVI
jgi:hypothetical protein